MSKKMPILVHFYPYDMCADFCWGRDHFLHRSWERAVFRICVEHEVDNVEMFSLLLSRAYMEPTPFLLFLLPC